MKLIHAVLLAALAAVAPWSAAAAPVEYALGVRTAGGEPAVITVELKLLGDKDGETVLEIPGVGADGTERWRLISGLTVKGASMRAAGDTKRILDHRPEAPITVRYEVMSAYGSEPPAENPPLKGPLLRDHWFVAPGFIFVTPEGREDDPARFEWGRLPKGWRVASNLEHGAAGQPMTVQNVFDGILVGGRELTMVKRVLGAADLRVAVLGREWTTPPDRIADALARILRAQRSYWGDVTTPFFVSVTPLAPANRGSVGGFGRWQGFALFGAVNSGLSHFEGNIAHEHTHTWIPARLGRMPAGPAQVADYWLSEGLTEFFGDRAALREGVWSTETYVAYLNRALRRYGESKARNAPNSEIAQKAFKDPAFRMAAYDRGRLLAFLWDAELARRTAGRKRLDDVVFAMRDRHLSAAPGRKVLLRDAFLSTYGEKGGIDLRTDIQRYVERGETITLPHNLFGACARVVEETATAANGRSVTFQQVELTGVGASARCLRVVSGAEYSP